NTTAANDDRVWRCRGYGGLRTAELHGVEIDTAARRGTHNDMDCSRTMVRPCVCCARGGLPFKVPERDHNTMPSFLTVGLPWHLQDKASFHILNGRQERLFAKGE